MNKSKPTVSETQIGWTREVVMPVQELWLLTYAGQPVSVKRWNTMHPDAHIRYYDMIWTQRKRGELMVRRLNQRHRTDAFGLVCLTAQTVQQQCSDNAGQDGNDAATPG